MPLSSSIARWSRAAIPPRSMRCGCAAGARPQRRCLFVTSLKDERSAAFLRAALAGASARRDRQRHRLCDRFARRCRRARRFDARSCRSRWPASSRAPGRRRTRGLSPRDLAMHVVLPEVDGRIFANAIAFKERGDERRRLRADGPFQPHAGPRRLRPPILRAPGSRLRRAPRPPSSRVAIVLANYPNRDGRLANGVGLDTPQSLAAICSRRCASAGYDVGGAPRAPPR